MEQRFIELQRILLLAGRSRHEQAIMRTLHPLDIEHLERYHEYLKIAELPHELLRTGNGEIAIRAFCLRLWKCVLPFDADNREFERRDVDVILAKAKRLSAIRLEHYEVDDEESITDGELPALLNTAHVRGYLRLAVRPLLHILTCSDLPLAGTCIDRSAAQDALLNLGDDPLAWAPIRRLNKLLREGREIKMPVYEERPIQIIGLPTEYERPTPAAQMKSDWDGYHQSYRDAAEALVTGTPAVNPVVTEPMNAVLITINERWGGAWKNFEHLSDDSGFSVSTVHKAVEDLRKIGLCPPCIPRRQRRKPRSE